VLRGWLPEANLGRRCLDHAANGCPYEGLDEPAQVTRVNVGTIRSQMNFITEKSTRETMKLVIRYASVSLLGNNRRQRHTRP
jgi:hypothetical protein